MIGQLFFNRDMKSPFKISNGAKQSCILTLVFFNILFAYMPSHAPKDLEEGFYIRYRFDVSIFTFVSSVLKHKLFIIFYWGTPSLIVPSRLMRNTNWANTCSIHYGFKFLVWQSVWVKHFINLHHTPPSAPYIVPSFSNFG